MSRLRDVALRLACVGIDAIVATALYALPINDWSWQTCFVLAVAMSLHSDSKLRRIIDQGVGR